MQRLGYGRLIVGLVASAVLIGIGWIVLEYLVPSPPSRVTIATGRKGTTFDYFGERYRQRFASAGVELRIRGTAGALENFQLLRDRNSNVQIAFLTGGISNKIQAPKLRFDELEACFVVIDSAGGTTCRARRGGSAAARYSVFKIKVAPTA